MLCCYHDNVTPSEFCLLIFNLNYNNDNPSGLIDSTANAAVKMDTLLIHDSQFTIHALLFHPQTLHRLLHIYQNTLPKHRDKNDE